MTTTAGPIFCQQPNDVDVNATMMAEPGPEDGITRGGGEGTEEE
jgi:hypothetical protein